MRQSNEKSGQKYAKHKIIALIVITIFVIAGSYVYLNPILIWKIDINYRRNSCTYPEGRECSSDEICVNLDKNLSKCVSRISNFPTIPFPRDVNTPVICTQGPLSNLGRTHTYLNTAFAVDLSTPLKVSNAKIMAVFDGNVITNEGCDNKDNSDFNNDDCGMGFGNWVLLVDNDSDLMAFYAHLRNVIVADGTNVTEGTEIGEEGKTGAAGHRHLHFSIHRNIWRLTREKILKYGIWLPPSIPFKTFLKGENGTAIVTQVTDLPCEDNNDLTRAPFWAASHKHSVIKN